MAVIALPMYDWPEVRGATDAWGAGLARHLRRAGFPDVPLGLERSGHYQDSWKSPQLLLSQTCGYSFANEFSTRLAAIVTPNYLVEGCDGPNYSSFIMVRAGDGVSRLEDLEGKRAAFNNRDSMSGMLALKLVFAPLAANGRFFASALESGGHVKSLEAVKDGTADVCATDAVCVALARRYRPDLLEGLRHVARSPSVPGLPYVTLATRSDEELGALRDAVADAFDDPSLRVAREQLFLAGFSLLAPADYAVMRNLERDMSARGGLTLWDD